MMPTQITLKQPIVRLTQRGSKFTGPGINVSWVTVIRTSVGKTDEMYRALVVIDSVACKATALLKDCSNPDIKVSRYHPLQLRYEFQTPISMLHLP